MKHTGKLFLILSLAAATSLTAQAHRADDDDSLPTMAHRELDGPRVGLVVISGAAALERLREHDLNQLMTVFGWHFEQMTRPSRNGPSLVTEEVLMVAGADQGVFIPSATLLFGLRTPGGFEIGMGPNVSPFGGAMAFGIGKSLNYGGVRIPLNLALVQSKGATRVTFVAGYAIRRS